MARHVDLGIFIPIGNNGWIISETAPQYSPTWELNRDVTIAAERLGYDYVFSMVKWRGFDGATKHWNYTLESLSLMSALAAVTQRIRLVASVQPLLIPPAVAAKMGTTIDQISNGRFGMNVVAGTYFDEYAQMGLLPDGYPDYRYDYAQEWVQLVKRLWQEESVTHHGQYFQLEDCRSDPKPVQAPHPAIVCAGTSPRGLAFTAEEGTDAFIAAQTFDSIKQYSREVKAKAEEFGRQLRTNTVLIIVEADTDAEAESIVEGFRAGADAEALSNVFQTYSKDSGGTSSKMLMEMARQSVFYGVLLAGSHDTIADTIADLVVDGQLDGVMLSFPDYLAGTELFAREVFPRLRERGLELSSAGDMTPSSDIIVDSHAAA